MTYEEYLCTPAWKELSRQCKERDGGRCVVCNGARNLDAHHRFYPRNLADTKLEHLTTLCRRHHELFHAAEGRGGRGLVKPHRKGRGSVREQTSGDERAKILGMLVSGEFTQTEIAEALDLRTRLVWGHIGALNSQGLLMRRKAPSNGRDKSKTTLWRAKASQTSATSDPC